MKDRGGRAGVPFSDRECELMGLMGSGMSIKEAANSMGIGYASSKVYLQNMKKKARCKTTYQMVDQYRAMVFRQKMMPICQRLHSAVAILKGAIPLEMYTQLQCVSFDFTLALIPKQSDTTFQPEKR